MSEIIANKEIRKILRYCIKENIKLSGYEIGVALLVLDICTRADMTADPQKYAHEKMMELFYSLSASISATLNANMMQPPSDAIN